MLNLNAMKLEQVIQVAFDRVTGNRRWETAIVSAKQILESNPYLHMAGDTLLMLSDSGEIYEVTATRCHTVRGDLALNTERRGRQSFNAASAASLSTSTTRY